MPTKGFGYSKRKVRPRSNWAEMAAVEACNEVGIELSRRGFPDFAVIQNGEIVGFIEVKPAPDRQLRIAQEAFKRMCVRAGIPYAKWCPGEPMPQFLQKVRLYQGRNKAAD